MREASAEAPAMVELGTVTRDLLASSDAGLDEHAVAKRICQACVAGLDVDGAVISLLTATVSRETLWATDPTAELLEELQFTLNEGACMEAATTGVPVLVADLHHSTDVQRWPIFAAAVAEQADVRALFAFPLQWGTVNVGVLDLYRKTPGALSAAQCRDAISASETGASMLLGVRTDPGHTDADGLPGGSWLDHSHSSRAEIHQATGIVLAQLGISAQDALARMRAYAFVERRLLIDVAREVVSRRLQFTAQMK
ncbi:GAF and ANTAR domain-containing protein [Pseudonocardia sp. GCM10023141]